MIGIVFNVTPLQLFLFNKLNCFFSDIILLHRNVVVLYNLQIEFDKFVFLESGVL